MIQQLLISILFLLFPIISFGGASSGGEISYQCLGEGDEVGTKKYKVTIEFYLGCLGWADQLGYGIKKNNQDFGTGIADADTIHILNPPEFPCTNIPQDFFCVKKHKYSDTIDLPVIDESYFFVFQNSGRPDSILNIFDPDTLDAFGIGVSIFVELTPLAQQSCNSSPKFLNPPNPVFCVGTPFTFDHAATENDGDQLIYKFYRPFRKNDETLSYAFSEPPPYPYVTFKVPEYSHLYPFGQESPLLLDANTGMLSGTGIKTGLYLVGISVEEYRNGQLLSTVYRDFIFNIVDCIPHINADLITDRITPNGDYEINICNDNQVTIQNISTDTNYINNLFWTFDGVNSVDTFYDWNPTLDFSTSGTFNGQLFINPGEECADTASIIINVNTLLEADFEVDFDTCVGGEVSFFNQSDYEGGDTIIWQWDFGDGDSSAVDSPNHQYQSPGTQTVSLVTTNDFGCKDTVTTIFDWTPAPPIIVIAPSSFEGCQPLAVFFENQSIPVDSTYDVVWDFGDGAMSTAISPSYQYQDTGSFDISVSITSPIGCHIDTTFYNWINVAPAPQADFYWEPQHVSSLQPDLTFINQSSEDILWQWNVDDEIFSFSQNANYVFEDTGLHNITLTVFDIYNCQDSLTQIVDVKPESTYFLPNAFSPNGDGKNDVFLGKGVLGNISSFEMTIYNRWGELVFQTNDPRVGWNGRDVTSGQFANQGVYNCFVKYQSARSPVRHLQQSVILIK